MASSWTAQRVLVPVDLSGPSARALEVAGSICESVDGLHVVHVLPDLSATEPGVVWETVTDETRTEHAENAVRKWMPEKLRSVRVSVRIGNAAREITALAAEQASELIVLSSHGRTGTARLLIGSVAEHVVRLASCPVLVLRS